MPGTCVSPFVLKPCKRQPWYLSLVFDLRAWEKTSLIWFPLPRFLAEGWASTGGGGGNGGVGLWGVRDGLPGFHGSGSYTKAHSLARGWLQGWITLNRSDAISTVQCNTKLNMQASGSIALTAAFLIIFFRDSVCLPNSNNGALAGQKLRSRRRFKMPPLARALPHSPERSVGDLEGRRRGEGERFLLWWQTLGLFRSGLVLF